MSSRTRLLSGLLLAAVAGAWTWSCTSGEERAHGTPTAAHDTPTAPDPCEEGWLPSDVKQATYTLRGGPEDFQLGHYLAVGDLDGDGLDDLAAMGFIGPQLYVVLGSTLFAHPPGEYTMTDVADYTLTTDAGAFGKTDIRIAREALYVSPISPYGSTPTYRVPFSALRAAGAGTHPVEALADATFNGVSPYGHWLQVCDLDADGVGDLIVGEYALLGETQRSGAVDLDTAGFRLQFDGPAHVIGPCTDLDDDGHDDFTAILYDSQEDAYHNFALGIWYGAGWVTPSGTTLLLRAPDVRIPIGGPPDAYGNPTESFMHVSQDAVGDWNGDGHTDLALEVDRYAASVEGTGNDVFLFLGEDGFRPSGTTLTRDDAFLTVSQDGGSLGRPLALAGDLNGDGRDDLVLASYVDVNEIYVRYCPLASGSYSYDEFAQITYAAAAGDDLSKLGHDVLTHGDLDGNGVDDLVFTAPRSTVLGVDGLYHQYGAIMVMAN